MGTENFTHSVEVGLKYVLIYMSVLKKDLQYNFWDLDRFIQDSMALTKLGADDIRFLYSTNIFLRTWVDRS